MSKKKAGFEFEKKAAKKGAAADTAEAPVKRRRRGGAKAGQGKSLTKPILGSVRVMKTQGGGVNIIVTPFTL